MSSEAPEPAFEPAFDVLPEPTVKLVGLGGDADLERAFKPAFEAALEPTEPSFHFVFETLGLGVFLGVETTASTFRCVGCSDSSAAGSSSAGWFRRPGGTLMST